MSSASDAFAHCEALVRAADKDRFLTALFAPSETRGALYALYAFNIEVARIRELINEPLAGEIRLQWWSDALAGKASGSVEANPVAAALCATIERYRLPLEPLDNLIAARRFDLYDDPMRTLADFSAYARATSSGLIALAARTLAGPDAPHIADPLANPLADPLAAMAHHAGLAYAATGLLQAFPAHVARGQLFLPLDVLERQGVDEQDVRTQTDTSELRAALAELRALARTHLDQARALAEALPPAVLPAFLTAALVRPLLDRMERKDYDPFTGVTLPQWRRQWRLWRAAGNAARIFS